MDTKELPPEIARISVRFGLLKSLSEMRNREACKWYCDAYGQLGNEKVSKELYFWRNDDNQDALLVVVETEQKKLCNDFEKLCEELCRHKVFGEAYVSESEDIAIDFLNLFLDLVRGAANRVLLRKVAQTSEKVLSMACGDVREMWADMLRIHMMKNSLSEYMKVMTDIFEARGVSEQKTDVFFALFGALVRKREIRL